MLITSDSRLAVDGRPYTSSDVKVEKHTASSTHYPASKWQTYYFTIKGDPIFPLIIKENGYFKFWSLQTTTLRQAKEHIAECFNTGKEL